METTSLHVLKKELSEMPPAELVAVCIKLAKYKKENKEFLAYLLFDSNYEPEYINKIKLEMDLMFTGVNKGNLYFVKKNLRKILRMTNKYIKYSGQKRTETELRIHYCLKLRRSGIRIDSGTAISNILEGQVMKISKAMSMLHEDLQHDYQAEIRQILQ